MLISTITNFIEVLLLLLLISTLLGLLAHTSCPVPMPVTCIHSACMYQAHPHIHACVNVQCKIILFVTPIGALKQLNVLFGGDLNTLPSRYYEYYAYIYMSLPNDLCRFSL